MDSAIISVSSDSISVSSGAFYTTKSLFRQKVSRQCDQIG